MCWWDVASRKWFYHLSYITINHNTILNTASINNMVRMYFRKCGRCLTESRVTMTKREKGKASTNCKQPFSLLGQSEVLFLPSLLIILWREEKTIFHVFPLSNINSCWSLGELEPPPPLYPSLSPWSAQPTTSSPRLSRSPPNSSMIKSSKLKQRNCKQRHFRYYVK